MTFLVLALNLVVVFGLAVLIWKYRSQSIGPLFWPALILKVIAGIGLGLIYQRYYSTGDTFYLFDLAKEQAQLFQSQSGAYFDFLWRDVDVEWKGAARSVFFVKIVSLFAIVTDGNYWMTSVWFSFLSFLGSIYLVDAIIQFFPESKLAASLSFLFFPSVVFWSSGVIKESVALPALLVISVVFLKTMMNQKPKLIEFVFGLFAFWIVWNLKYYWIAVLVPGVITSLIVQYTAFRFRIASAAKLLYWSVLFIVLCLGVSLTHPNFYLERFLQVVIENNHAFVSVSDPSDLIQYSSLTPDWLSIVSNSPWALISGLLRPFVWEANTDLKVVVAFENLTILLLSIGSLMRIRHFFSDQNRQITLCVLVYIVLLCIFLTLSTPNLGSLARYKVGFLPFLIFLITYKNPMIELAFSFQPLKYLKRWLK